MELIGRGRSAEIFAVDERTVLRRGRRDAAPEARLLAHLADAGYPVPRVVGAEGNDLLLERIQGPDLFAAVRTGALAAAESMRMLGELAARLSSVDPPEWLEAAPDAEPGADRIVHLDLHHENVLLAHRGPVVIDWEGARRGDRALDVAMTTVILLTDVKPRAEFGARMPELAATFVTASGIDPESAMERAVRRRLRDGNLSDAERAIVAELLPGRP